MILVLHNRPVGLLAYRLDVYAEEQVSHGRIAHDNDFVDLPAVESECASHIADLKVNRRQHHLAELAVELASVVGDAVHDVASAETLGVLKRGCMDDVAGLQVEEVHGDRCRADVHGEAVDTPAVGVDAPSVEDYGVAVARSQWIEVDLPADRVG